MAHHYSNSLYDRLADRLNQFPQGAPLSDSLFAILKILFSEKEAGLVAQLINFLFPPRCILCHTLLDQSDPARLSVHPSAS